MTAIGIEQLRAAIELRRPEVTVAGLRQLAGPQAVAMAIRPDPAQLHDVTTAARLARQGQALSKPSIPRRALAPAPTTPAWHSRQDRHPSRPPADPTWL